MPIFMGVISPDPSLPFERRQTLPAGDRKQPFQPGASADTGRKGRVLLKAIT